MSTFNSGFGTAFDRPIYPSRVTPSPQSLYGSSNRRSIPSVGALSNSPGLTSPVSPAMPRTNDAPLMPSVKFGMQSAPMQSPQAQQDKMTMGLIHQNVELPPPEPTTRLAAQAGTSSGVSEQNLHQMYTTIQQQHPTLSQQDHAQMFNDTAARYGYNGAALLDKWGGQGIANTPSFPTGETTATPATPGMPVSMLGSPNSAGNSTAARVPGMSAAQTGMTIGGSPAGPSTPIMGPMQGVTTPAPGMVLPTTNSRPLTNDVNDQALARMQTTRDAATTPVPQADQDRIARNDQTRVRALGDSEIANLPPTQREQFNAATDVATSAAQVPLAVAQTNAQSKVDAAKALANRGAGGKVANPADQRIQVAEQQLLHAAKAYDSSKKPEDRDLMYQRMKELDAAQNDRATGAAPPGAAAQPTAQPPAINGDGSPDPYATAGAQPNMVRVRHPNGQTGTIPSSQLPEAIRNGYTQVQ